jgi:NAD+ kinase
VVKSDLRAREKADELDQWLRKRAFDVVCKQSPPPRGVKPEDENEAGAPPDLHCVFVLGGDGTFLSAVRWIGSQAIPVIGVKFGEVGFLADTVESNLYAVAELILKNQFDTRPRMRLLVDVERDGRQRASETVLNDAVINKGALARLATIDTYIDEQYLTTYRADGLIVATPTGSTAYSLAAGGPVVHPDVPAMIMAPICPFTLTNRPVILPDSAKVTIRLSKGSSDIMLTFDGQLGLEIGDRDTITIRKSQHPVRMISVPNQSYFDVLKAKLRWSGGRV